MCLAAKCSVSASSHASRRSFAPAADSGAPHPPDSADDHDVLAPAGVGVVVEARHMCMSMRGAQKAEAETVTSSMLGQFRDDARTREEFLSLVQGRRK